MSCLKIGFQNWVNKANSTILWQVKLCAPACVPLQVIKRLQVETSQTLPRYCLFCKIKNPGSFFYFCLCNDIQELDYFLCLITLSIYIYARKNWYLPSLGMSVLPSCYVSLTALPSCYVSLTAQPPCYVSLTPLTSCYVSLTALPSCYVSLTALPPCYVSLTALPSCYVSLTALPPCYVSLTPSIMLCQSYPPTAMLCQSYPYYHAMSVLPPKPSAQHHAKLYHPTLLLHQSYCPTIMLCQSYRQICDSSSFTLSK